ncbi:MAG: SDR family oxidoreductase [Chloroflexi bacterium]|nr:MAG: SDR family oxidoreductase [Chloroflexota bacterium]
MILLAGGTGHLGVALTELLSARGNRVRVLSRDPSRARVQRPGVELVAGDVRVASSLESALVGVDTVISAVTGFGPRGSGPRQVDLQGNQRLIAAAAAAGVEHFVLVSIHGASPDHPMELYRAKFMAEESLRRSSLEWTIVRPTPFMELWAGIVGDSLIRSGVATVFGRGENPINFVSVRDVARFIELALTDRRLRGRILEIGGPENVTLRTVVEVVAASAGRQPKARHIPARALRLGAALLRPFRPDLAGLIQASVRMDSANMRFDVARLTAEHPQIHLSRLEEVAVRRQQDASAAV